MFTARLGRLGLAFLTNILIARHLGAEGFGILGVGISLATIGSILVTQGIETPLRLTFMNDPKTAGSLLATINLYRILLAGLFFVIGFLLTDLGKSTSSIAIIICISSVFCLPLQTIDLLIQAKNRLQLSSYLFIGSVLGGTALRLVLLYHDATVSAFALAYLAESMLLSFLLTFGGIFVLRTWPFASSFNLVQLGTILKKNITLILSSVLIILYMRIDMLLTAHFLGFEASGVFSVAQRVTEVFYIAPSIMTTVALSDLNFRARTGNAGYENAQVLFYAKHLRFAIGAVVILLIAGPMFEFIILAGRYHGLSKIVALLALAIPFAFLGSARSTLLTLESKQQYVFFSSVIGILMAFLLGPPLIMSFGVFGSCMNYLFSQAISSFLSSLVFSDIRKHFYLQIAAAKSIFTFKFFIS